MGAVFAPSLQSFEGTLTYCLGAAGIREPPAHVSMEGIRSNSQAECSQCFSILPANACFDAKSRRQANTNVCFKEPAFGIKRSFPHDKRQTGKEGQAKFLCWLSREQCDSTTRLKIPLLQLSEPLS